MFNEQYCKWCYCDGEYTYANMDDLIRYCAEHMANENFTSDLGNQLECEFGGGRCFDLVANMEFLLVCTYEENGANPELVLYKKR